MARTEFAIPDSACGGVTAIVIEAYSAYLAKHSFGSMAANRNDIAPE